MTVYVLIACLAAAAVGQQAAGQQAVEQQRDIGAMADGHWQIEWLQELLTDGVALWGVHMMHEDTRGCSDWDERCQEAVERWFDSFSVSDVDIEG